MRFEWVLAKASANLRKHQVSFEEARTVFYDDFATQFFDEGHSFSEESAPSPGFAWPPEGVRENLGAARRFLMRFIMLGMSSTARLLIVCHCERDRGEVIRIISARRATRSEATHYRGG